jgi:sec-independent protein translocase protein TatB
MLDFSFGELILVVLVALIVVGPKELPVLMYKIGRWIGQIKGIGEEFTSGFKSAINDAGLQSMQKDIHEINNEIEYITDMEGNLQPTYDISHLINKEHKILIEKDNNE